MPLPPRTDSLSDELLLCGRHEVRVLEGVAESARVTFSYRLADAPELGPQQRELMAWFHSTDEIKPVDGGQRFLITSVGGCAAFLDRQTRGLRVFAWADGLHSAELLPGGLVVLAVSHPTDQGAPGDGNRLALYDPRRPFAELWSEPFVSAHAVVWDDSRGVLWALGREELRVYRLARRGDEGPRLERESSAALPATGGHDLQAVPGTPDLLLSVSGGAYLFDRDTRLFRPHALLGATPLIKSVSVHPRTGRIAVVQAEAAHGSYAGRILLYEPQGVCPVPGPPVYKARWC